MVQKSGSPVEVGCLSHFTLAETNNILAPENGWLEDELVSFLASFSSAFAVSFREGIYRVFIHLRWENSLDFRTIKY